MIDKVLASKNISTGSASRYIKSRWMQTGFLSTEAFDLRDGTPPETYVSHFLTNGNSLEEKFISAYTTFLGKKFSGLTKGSIAILEIIEALEEINDEAEPFVEFIEQGLPHCGLVYLTPKQEKIQEVKATLCLLAKKRLRLVKSIETSKVSAYLQPPT